MKCCNSYILEMKPKMINFYEQVSSKHSIRQPFTPERIPVQKHSYHLLHLYIVNYNVLDLLPKKKKKLRAELESVLALLGEPKQDQRPVEMLGYLDLEKIVEDLKNPEKGISTFFFSFLFFSFFLFLFTIFKKTHSLFYLSLDSDSMNLTQKENKRK